MTVSSLPVCVRTRCFSKRAHWFCVSHCGMCTFWISPHTCGCPPFQNQLLNSQYFIFFYMFHWDFLRVQFLVAILIQHRLWETVSVCSRKMWKASGLAWKHNGIVSLHWSALCNTCFLGFERGIDMWMKGKSRFTQLLSASGSFLLSPFERFIFRNWRVQLWQASHSLWCGAEQYQPSCHQQLYFLLRIHCEIHICLKRDRPIVLYTSPICTRNCTVH